MSAGQPDTLTLADVLWTAPGHRTAVVLPEQGVRLSYETLRSQVETVASTLRAAGVTRTDRVGIALPNGLPMIVCMLGATMAGIAAPINPRYRPSELRFYLDDARVRLLVVPTGADEAWLAAGSDVRVLTADFDPVAGLRMAGTPGGRFIPAPSPDDVALILHTSGSTGRPKRVPLSHANLSVSAHNVANTYRLGGDDVSLCVMPLFHVHGFVASLLATLATGGTAVVPSRFNALSFWQTARDHHATWYSAVPTVHQLLLKRHGDPRHAAPASHGFRFIRSCSAPLAPSTMSALERAFGVPVLEACGMTEAAHQIASNPLPDAVRKPGSVGRGTAVNIAIMGARGDHLPAGECGEVVIHGPNVITRYDDDPDADAASFVGRWFRTGDLGYLDGERYLTLVGRIKELINRGGEKIAPREIDEVLLSHPAVAEAACFGTPDATWGEDVAAAVVVSRDISESDLLAFCRARLAAHKCPKRIHITDVIPRGDTGKVQRRTLARHFPDPAS